MWLGSTAQVVILALIRFCLLPALPDGVATTALEFIVSRWLGKALDEHMRPVNRKPSARPMYSRTWPTRTPRP